MEVWVLEQYLSAEGTSETLNVYENVDVAINEVKRLHIDIIWAQIKDGSWASNQVDDVIYYINKFEVILDEVPN
jgi:hypothetical protein